MTADVPATWKEWLPNPCTLSSRQICEVADVKRDLRVSSYPLSSNYQLEQVSSVPDFNAEVLKPMR